MVTRAASDACRVAAMPLPRLIFMLLAAAAVEPGAADARHARLMPCYLTRATAPASDDHVHHAVADASLIASFRDVDELSPMIPADAAAFARAFLSFQDAAC